MTKEERDAMNQKIAARRNRGQLRRPGEDVLVQAERGRQIAGGGSPTAGVGTVDQDIIEMPAPRVQKARRRVARFASVDGNTYEMRIHGAKGKALPGREVMCLFAALREWRLGGDPLVVLEAYRLRLEDVNGKTLFPLQVAVPPIEDIDLTLAGAFGVAEPEEIGEEDGIPNEFGLAEDA
jgi:hypothetical protein